MSVHDRWIRVVDGEKVRTAAYGKGLRYEVRWREAGVQQKKRFLQRQQADIFDAKRKVAPEVRLAAEGRLLTVAQMMATWLATKQGLEPKTLLAYADDVRQVELAFGDRLASGLRPSEVRAWTARPHPGASLRRRSFVALRAAYKLAIADQLLASNPTEDATLPRVDREEMRFLSWDELEDLAAATRSFAGPTCEDCRHWVCTRIRTEAAYAALVMVLGTCGIRIGEAVRLDQADVDRKRLRLRIRKPKNHHSRDVPIEADVLAMLPTGTGPLFRGERGGRLDVHYWRGGPFRQAAQAVGLWPMHPHELRHTAASLAIAAGADPKTVQRMLGHRSGAMTLDLYTHLWDAQLDTVASRMGLARREAKARRQPTELRLIRGAGEGA